MGSGNAHTWHDRMCQGHTLVATLVQSGYWLGVTFTLVVM
jgi:hypothetical protein